MSWVGEIKEYVALRFFASVLFLCHPIQTESVIYIMSRSEVLASTFYLIGFLLFQQLLERPLTSRLQYCFYFLIIFLFFLLGFSVKQILATLPALMVLYYLFSCSNHSPAWQFFQKWKWVILSIFSVIVGLLIYRLFTDETFLIGPSRTYEMVGRAKYMLSQPAVIVFYYLKMLLFPINLNIDPDIEIVISVLSLSFFNPCALYSFIASRLFSNI